MTADGRGGGVNVRAVGGCEGQTEAGRNADGDVRALRAWGGGVIQIFPTPAAVRDSQVFLYSPGDLVRANCG